MQCASQEIFSQINKVSCSNVEAEKTKILRLKKLKFILFIRVVVKKLRNLKVTRDNGRMYCNTRKMTFLPHFSD